MSSFHSLLTIFTNKFLFIFFLGIHPRSLSLEIIGENLDNLQYNTAMNILRKERINLNILCDHNIALFFENMETFIEDIANMSWLNLFLSDLKNEDVTKTMFAGSYSHRTPEYPLNEQFSISTKVDFICKELCKLMKSKDTSKYILPIITTYVKTNQIEMALRIVWDERNKGGNKKTEEALTYLLYLVDVNNLFNVALGMYDFELVLFVAAKSQKDPKEFLPFLNELNSYEENYRKFKIDEYLKKYEKALEHIAKCGSERFEEALQFIEKYKVFRKALSEYYELKDCYTKICSSFAEYLRGKGKLDNASIMYERAGDISQAIQTAKNSLNWRKCLYLCKDDEREALATVLIQSLEKAGNYQDAFQVHKNFCNNLEESITLLIKGKLFLKAIFECRMGDTKLLGKCLLLSYLQICLYLSRNFVGY